MPKLKSGADRKLIEAGLGLAKSVGLSGFTVRELCKKAKINPGLFHYYFTSRENFDKAVLKELYGTLLKDIVFNVPSSMPSKEKLVAVRDSISSFINHNRSLISSVIVDIISGNKEMFSFIRKNFTSHIMFVLSVIEECKKEGVLEDADSLSVLFSFVMPVVIPSIVPGIFEKVLDKKELLKIKPFIDRVLSEKSSKERERLSLKAVLK